MKDEAPATDAVLILAAELHRVGFFDAANLATMAKRLGDCGHTDLAARMSALPLSNALTDPEAMRAGIYAIDGGNGGEE